METNHAKSRENLIHYQEHLSGNFWLRDKCATSHCQRTIKGKMPTTAGVIGDQIS